MVGFKMVIPCPLRSYGIYCFRPRAQAIDPIQPSHAWYNYYICILHADQSISCDVMMDACTCVMNMWTAPWLNINDQSPARNCMHSLSRDAMMELNRYNVLYYRHGRLSGYTGHS